MRKDYGLTKVSFGQEASAQYPDSSALSFLTLTALLGRYDPSSVSVPKPARSGEQPTHYVLRKLCLIGTPLRLSRYNQKVGGKDHAWTSIVAVRRADLGNYSALPIPRDLERAVLPIAQVIRPFF